MTGTITLQLNVKTQNRERGEKRRRENTETTEVTESLLPISGMIMEKVLYKVLINLYKIAYNIV